MQTYTAIALLSLLGITLSASAAKAFEPPVQMLETATAQYMLSAQTQQKGERGPERGSGRRRFTQPNVTHPL
ncbi:MULTISPECIES: heterocyst-inhibiting protein PatX [unclassified Microcoleus]|uniref:heterocyst-inhibiting protein PatX n=1 Tax=unclassified Microcoleus TaxID=2642155 RepID=UPI002FCFA067